MGRPAPASRRRAATPSLRAVKPRTVRGRGSSARYDNHCRDLFNLACVIMLAATIFALARVTLAASAAEVAIDSGELNRAIKAERLAGDLLECDKSALTTPSRIGGIAAETLRMAEAPQVSYLRLPTQPEEAESTEESTPATVADAAPADTASAMEDTGGVRTASLGGFSGMLASVMQMAAGEAEVLLVGDAGLASTR